MSELRDLVVGSDVQLSQDVLDEIDAIVPPGCDLHPGDSGGFDSPELAPAGRRRSLASKHLLRQELRMPLTVSDKTGSWHDQHGRACE